MKKKFFLPMMAMVVAIGMSFATERSTADPVQDYVVTPLGIESISEVKDCGNDMQKSCTAELSVNENPYPVFDSLEDIAENNPKLGGAEAKRHR